MRKIEKTKEKIGVSELDEQTRKKLFNEFVEAGGQVIKEKKENGLSDYNRELQKKFKQPTETERKQNKLTEDRSKTTFNKSSQKSSANLKSTSKYPTATPKTKKIGKLRLFFQRHYIKIRLFFMNVTDSTGYYFTENFFQIFDNEYKLSLLSLQVSFNNLFKQNLRLGNKIIDELDKMNLVFFEAMELLSNIFDRTVINELLEYHYNFPDVPQKTRELREPLTAMFRKLHPLTAYKDAISTGFEKAFTMQTRMEKKNSLFDSSDKKKTKNDIYLIFNKLYPRLYWLMCYYENRILMSEKDIEDRISISMEDRPGRRRKNAPKLFELSFGNNLSTNDSEQNIEQNNQVETIPDSIKEGLALMQKIDTDENIEILKKNSIFKSINKNDKIFVINLLLEEFDREYSFILTTNKLKYNNILKTSDNLDFKTKFVNLYNEIGKCKNILNDYANSLVAFEKLKLEKPISSTQYIEYSNRLRVFEKEKNQAAIDAKMYAKSFFEKLCKELKILIDDMDKAKNIVINPKDIIIFEREIEGEKKLNNKNVYEAISCTYSYAMAFIYRLSPSGDIESDIESGEGEKDTSVSNTEKSGLNKENNVKETGIEKEKKTEKKESILKELDDLL